MNFYFQKLIAMLEKTKNPEEKKTVMKVRHSSSCYLYVSNRVCCPDGPYWDYSTGTLSFSEATATHLKIGYT